MIVLQGNFSPYPPASYGFTAGGEFTQITGAGTNEGSQKGGSTNNGGGGIAGGLLTYSNSYSYSADGEEGSSSSFEGSQELETPQIETTVFRNGTAWGLSTAWPIHELNGNLTGQIASVYTETDYNYLDKSTLYFNNNTSLSYSKALLNINNTQSQKYRTYRNPDLAGFLELDFRAVVTDNGRMGEQGFFETILSANNLEETIFPLYAVAPGRLVHITDYNVSYDGIRSIALPPQSFGIEKMQFSSSTRNVIEGFRTIENHSSSAGDVVTFDSSLAVLLPKFQLIGNYSGISYVTEHNNYTELYHNNNKYYRKYSIRLPSSIKTELFLNNQEENQLINYDYEGLYKSVFKNSKLQEFQERTLGVTNVNYIELPFIGGIHFTEVKTKNSQDAIQFLDQVNFKPAKQVEVTNAFDSLKSHVNNIILTFSPGVFYIHKIPSDYSFSTQYSLETLSVHPNEISTVSNFEQGQFFFIERGIDVYWGGLNEDNTNINLNFSDRPKDFAIANAWANEFVFPITQLHNKYAYGGFDALNFFGMEKSLLDKESTSIFKASSSEPLETIWKCYTQFPYSSIYNTEF